MAQGSHLLRMNEARTVRIGSGEESRSQAGKYWINNNFDIYNKKHYSLIKLNFWKNCYYRICHTPGVTTPRLILNGYEYASLTDRTDPEPVS